MDKPLETLRLERRGALATLSLSRPGHRNGVNGTMMTELHRTLQALAADPDLRVLLLRGDGGDFCPGADIKHHAGRDAGAAARPTATPLAQFDVAVLLHEMPAVTVAAIDGACAGAALGWACACDLRIAAPTARFNTAFLDVGVAGDMGLPWTLPRLLGAARARELCFLPGKFGADEALRLGLVSRVSAPGRLDAEASALAERLAGAAPLALQAMKANFLAAERLGFADFIALESEKHLRLFATEDRAEAFRAFVEKRPPVFSGR